MNDALMVVAAVGRAEGALAAAAALACAGAEPDRASLFIDLGGRAPRPTLLASAAARRLEERLAAHLPRARAASRGLVCHLALPADSEGFEALASAVPLARDSASVLHVSPPLLQLLLDAGVGVELSAALLRADLRRDRALTALVARDLKERGLRVAVLKQPLGWVASRRALFGTLPSDASGGLPGGLLCKMGLSHECYAARYGARADSARAAKPEWGDHAGA